MRKEGLLGYEKYEQEEKKKREEEVKKQKEREEAEAHEYYALARLPVPHDANMTAVIPSGSYLGRRIKKGGEEREDNLSYERSIEKELR